MNRQRIWKVVAGRLTAVALLAYLPVQAATTEKPSVTTHQQAFRQTLPRPLLEFPGTSPYSLHSDNDLITTGIFNVKWSDIKPARTTYDWTTIEEKVSDWYIASGKPVWLNLAPYSPLPLSVFGGTSNDNHLTPQGVYNTGVPHISFRGAKALPRAIPYPCQKSGIRISTRFTKSSSPPLPHNTTTTFASPVFSRGMASSAR